MSFDLDVAVGYGSGSLGDVSDPPYAIVNAYAAVIDIKTYSLTLAPISNSQYQSWDNCVGCQVMLHACAATSGNAARLGNYMIATITAQESTDDGLNITLDQSTALAVQGQGNVCHWQAVLIPEFKNLTLQTQSLKPDIAAINNTPLGSMSAVTAPCGGVLVFKCSDTLTLKGGHLDLRDAGFPINISTTYRPNFSHENNGTLDTDLHSGSENSIAQSKLIINGGDGACLVLAKHINCASGSSRIGNPATSGVQYCRGASDSDGTPAGVSNLGGSTIALVTNDFTNFTPNLIAKYRSGSTGRGLARAYLAVRNAYNNIKPDEGLYALDTIKNTERLKSMCNISGFGNGQDGNWNFLSVTPPKCFNQYAKVTAISGKVYTLSKLSLDVESIIDWQVGRLVLIHQSRKTSANDFQDGRFRLSRITAISGSTVTIKHNFSFDLSTYNVQMILIPEFNSLILNQSYNHTPAYQNGAGGICAIACNYKCSLLSGGTINVEGKGTFGNVVNVGIGNYSMKCSVPLGQGHGSVFILARILELDSSSRIGATYDGSQFGGDTVINETSSPIVRTRSAQGGWKGADGSCSKYPEYAGTGGSGSAAGSCSEDSAGDGGWHSSAASTDSDYRWGCQGAHIFIAANTITGFNLCAISTGGEGGRNLSPNQATSLAAKKGGDGGAGYGGGGFPITSGTTLYRYGGAGGYRGGGATAHPATAVDYSGGGAAGACFVYCNNFSDQSTTGLVLF